jgi:hypothetical protein
MKFLVLEPSPLPILILLGLKYSPIILHYNSKKSFVDKMDEFVRICIVKCMTRRFSMVSIYMWDLVR